MNPLMMTKLCRNEWDSILLHLHVQLRMRRQRRARQCTCTALEFWNVIICYVNG